MQVRKDYVKSENEVERSVASYHLYTYRYNCLSSVIKLNVGYIKSSLWAVHIAADHESKSLITWNQWRSMGHGCCSLNDRRELRRRIWEAELDHGSWIGSNIKINEMWSEGRELRGEIFGS
jgi:hypothetical protein